MLLKLNWTTAELAHWLCAQWHLQVALQRLRMVVELRRRPLSVLESREAVREEEQGIVETLMHG
jgi:hypothetical protein